MNFQFATCDRQNALGFLRKLFPYRGQSITDTGTVKDVLDLVEADKIRVLDPEFHLGGITQSKATDAEWLEIKPTLQNMIDEIMAFPRSKQ
jgi:hypothetical protein